MYFSELPQKWMQYLNRGNEKKTVEVTQTNYKPKVYTDVDNYSFDETKEDGSKTIVIDENFAFYIKRAFEMYDSGMYSIRN